MYVFRTCVSSVFPCNISHTQPLTYFSPICPRYFIHTIPSHCVYLYCIMVFEVTTAYLLGLLLGSEILKARKLPKGRTIPNALKFMWSIVFKTAVQKKKNKTHILIYISFSYIFSAQLQKLIHPTCLYWITSEMFLKITVHFIEHG